MLPIAEFQPIPAAAQWAIVSILSVALILVLIWSALRRKPTIDVDLAQLASSMSQLAGTVSELKVALREYAGHASRIASLEEECATLRKNLAEEIHNQRSYTAKSSREIFERIERVEQSVANNFQSVERALGRVEGALAAKT